MKIYGILFLLILNLSFQQVRGDSFDRSFLSKEVSSFSNDPEEYLETVGSAYNSVGFINEPLYRDVELRKLKLFTEQIVVFYEGGSALNEDLLFSIFQDNDVHIPMRLIAGYMLIASGFSGVTSGDFVALSPSSVLYFRYFPDDDIEAAMDEYVRVWVNPDEVLDQLSSIVNRGGPYVVNQWNSAAIFLQNPKNVGLLESVLENAKSTGSEFDVHSISESIALIQKGAVAILGNR